MSLIKQSGFTLLELMVSIAILAVVAGIAVPSFVETMERARAKTQANTFYTALVTARSEAVKRNQSIVICKSANGTACTTSGNWEQGWITFVDVDEDSTLDTLESIIQVYAALDESTLRATNGSDDLLTYQSNGAQATTESFNLCVDDDTSNGRTISIGITGRPNRSEGASVCPS